ncbi:putative feruloyl esterase B-2 [Trapelia coarctata]|nr:putative feruloyl esterase B-2 [Trapelia coarctata]
MFSYRLTALFCTAIYLLPASATTPTFLERCQGFNAETKIHNSTIEVLQYVPASTNLSFPYNDPSCARPYQLVSIALCRIALSTPTSNRSSITFELWLPEVWSGRLLGTGNGGIDGCIKYEDLAYGTANGFATYGSNNGHNGTGGVAFHGNEDVVVDFAWRAVLAGKELVKQFYGKTYDKSYFLGCSLGGRQGIKSAEIFPEDFDGIVAGAPALDFNNLQSWRASFFPITGSVNSSDFITASTWTGLIPEEVLRQCDGLDGVMDGIIEDPDLCHFRPEALLCSSDTATNCLTPIQVEMVRKIFSPLFREGGMLIYPAMQPGSEVFAVQKLYAGKPFSYSENWFRYVVLNNPQWNASTFNIQDAAAAETLNPADIRTWPNDLSAFRNTGGKMISFHGGQDNQITSFNTERFHHHLRQGMQAPACELDEFFRFFRISGMFHCNSGPGAWVLGQGGGAAAAGVPFNRRQNVLAALVDWVENGVAPDTIEGTKFVNDSVALGVAFQRRHCRYPFRNTYVGGNYTLSSSWRCLEPPGEPRGFWCGNESRGYYS